MARSYQFAWEEAMMDSDLPAGLKHLGHALRFYASDDGTNIYPGVEALARRMSKSPRQVMRDLEALRSRGWIKRVRRGNKRARQADVYCLTMPDQVTSMSRSEECTDQSQSVQVTSMTRKTDEERPDQVTWVSRKAEEPSDQVTSETALGDMGVTPIPMNTQVNINNYSNNQGGPATQVASLPISKVGKPSEVTEPDIWAQAEAELAKKAQPATQVDPVSISKITKPSEGVPDEEDHQVRPAPDGPAFSGGIFSLVERERRRKERLAKREAGNPAHRRRPRPWSRGWVSE